MAARLLNKGFNGWAQLGIFLGMWGVGLIAGSFAALGVWTGMTGQGFMNMEQDMLNPQYATAVKMVQLVSTLFIFFVPAASYAFICYRNGWLALGFKKHASLKIAGISILILLASLPAIDAITLLNKLIPLPANSKSYFDNIEKSYEQQVKVIGDVKTTGQYLLSIFMIALLPAVFEETLFRGGLQNMLSRWRNNSFVYVFLMAVLLIAVKVIWLKNLNSWIFLAGLMLLLFIVYRSQYIRTNLNEVTNHFLFPIIFTSILFSAVHTSWYGFLPRVALGMLLGLLFYYTNNLAYNIFIHFINNATVVSFMFFNARQKKPIEIMGEHTFPLWTAIFSIAALVVLFKWLTRLPNEAPPEEIVFNRENPFENTIFETNDI